MIKRRLGTVEDTHHRVIAGKAVDSDIIIIPNLWNLYVYAALTASYEIVG